MTVEELIKYLNVYPKDMPVRLSVGRSSCCQNERCYCSSTEEGPAESISITFYNTKGKWRRKSKDSDYIKCVLIGEY